MVIIIPITQKESEILNSKYGFEFGGWGDIHHSNSRYKKYYVTESENVLRALREIRENNKNNMKGG